MSIPSLSDYDFLELVAFDAKLNWEGFDYTCEEYPPRFETAELRDIARNYSQLKALWLANRDAIAAFWDRPGANSEYDRHLDSAERRATRRGGAA